MADFGDARLPAFLWQRLTPSDGGCWLYNLKVRACGYAYCATQGSKGYVHRVVYEYLVGRIPAGLDLDHLCRVRHCANPSHLEPVTRSENVLRGYLPAISAARNSSKTHCPRGHEYSTANTYITRRGGRRCQTCHREQERVRR